MSSQKKRIVSRATHTCITWCMLHQTCKPEQWEKKNKSGESFSLVPSSRNTCQKTKETFNQQYLLPTVWLCIDPMETEKTGDCSSKYIKHAIYQHQIRPKLWRSEDLN